MKILVTGAHGYLGGRLVNFLEQKGHEVWRAVRRPSGHSREVVFDASRSSPLNLSGVGACVHLAGLSAADAQKDPELAFRVSVDGSRELAQQARQQGVKRFVFLSTAHVYGPLTGLIDENTPRRATHPYGQSRARAEDAIQEVWQGMATVFRLSNVVGAPASVAAPCWGLIVNDLCRQAVTLHQLNLQTPGLQRRNLIPMIDAVNAIEWALSMTSPAQGVFNLGGTETPTIREVAEKIRDEASQVLGRSIELNKPVAPAGAVEESLSFSSAKWRALGWRDHSSVQQAINETLKFCRAQFSSNG